MEGTVRHATFSLNGQAFTCIDSYVKHEFTFTPAISLYVTCDTEEEIDRLHARLSEQGEVYMPLAPYPFSKKFVWLADRYGVSWQLTLVESQQGSGQTSAETADLLESNAAGNQGDPQ